MNEALMKKWLKSKNVSISTLLLENYKKIGLTNDQLVFLIQLKSFVDQGEGFPDVSLIAERMELTREAAFKEIHNLINKSVLSIDTKTGQDGKSQDELSFDLLWEKLILLMKQDQERQAQETSGLTSKDLYNLFEQEFGRPLSPIEIQTLNMWIDEDHYDPELIQMALREAVLSQVYSLKYIDRILLSWEKKNIKNKDQVLKESQNHRNNQNKTNDSGQEQASSKPVPMYDWLKEYKD
ncbi:DnaD domain-containing protein [Marinilactibacillus sp. XAAS-LB27]|uniref:DnaD domain-containing protein n=1 Tax=Marinilactibacillus sp. XAAS-LB27 TaxID=3114538 RepID=UPI002E198B2B|nr:DnaD domain-containing protein [Marinilactibacillus sp. XAAS-LB27]